MPIPEDITRTLERGRAEMESLMRDTCRITKAGAGAPVFDEATGQYVHPARVTVYEGKCRLQVKADINSNVVETTAGEREWTYLTATLQVPITGTEEIRIDQVAEMLTAPHDPALVGRKLNIQGIYHKSQATHRRLRVREAVA